MITIDASVAVKWVVEESDSSLARNALDIDEKLIAPDLMLIEAANVLRKKERMREVNADQVAVSLRFIAETTCRFIHALEVVDDATLLARKLDHSVYDCVYLACALRFGVLVTADAKFLNKCRDAGYGDIVFHISDDFRLRIAHDIIDVDPVALESIDRLAPIIRETFNALKESNYKEIGTLKAYSLAALESGYSSPAYVRLSRIVAALDHSKIALLLALGWFGKNRDEFNQWPYLLRNATMGSLARSFEQHETYIMAQVLHAPDGLIRLKSYLETRV